MIDRRGKKLEGSETGGGKLDSVEFKLIKQYRTAGETSSYSNRKEV